MIALKDPELFPAPGIYQYLDEQEYHELEALSAHGAMQILRSPAHYRWWRDHPRTTKMLDARSAAHAIVLEPDLLDKKYMVADRCEATTKSGKRCENTGIHYRSGLSSWFCGVKGHDPGQLAEGPLDTRVVIDAETYDRCRGVRDAVMCKTVLPPNRLTELSVLWHDVSKNNSPHKILCKSRLDVFDDERSAVWDVKTCRDASPRAFARNCCDYGYLFQLGVYGEALYHHELSVKERFVVAVEWEPPHGVRTYKPREDDILKAFQAWLEAKIRFRRSVGGTYWPAYSSLIFELSLTAWQTQNLANFSGEIEEQNNDEDWF